MRWLIATDDFPPHDGGVATWTAAVAEGLRAAGDDVTVLARYRPDLQGAIGVRGPSFARRGGLWIGVRALRLPRPERILATTWPVATALIGVLGRGVPVDVVFHGSDLTCPPRDPRGFDRVCRATARRWCVSAFLRDALAARGYASAVLPAPVDADDPPPAAPIGESWAMIGRATPLKGGDRFVRLAAAAGARATVYGDGPERTSWQTLADELGADVTFRGHVPREVLRRELPGHAAVFLLSRAAADGSGAEGFGLSLVEAALAGVATVGCRTGGVPEACGAGLILADPDDVPGSLATFRAWWSADRGAACRVYARQTHGVQRTVAALRAASFQLSAVSFQPGQ